MTGLIDWRVWRPLDLAERTMAPEINRIALNHYWHGWTILACRAAALNELRRALRLMKVGRPALPVADVDHAAWLNGTSRAAVIGQEYRDQEPDEEWRLFALRLLRDEMAAVGQHHRESVKLMRAAALDAIQAGLDRRSVANAAVTVARERTPLPPPRMVQDAIEAAGREHRFSGQFWRKRERTG